MRSVNPDIYTKDYYLHTCLGGEEVHQRIDSFLHLITVQPKMKVLDIGCGRGDLAIACAEKGATVVGIDYAKDGITIANNNVKKQSKKIQDRVHFLRMDAKKLQFPDNSFDVITSVDVFEHLYKEELEQAMREISRVLKPGGKLLVHTETNKVYLDFTHRIWSYPADQFLITINRLLTKKEYPGLQKDPRNDFHKMQHVNEPTYLYLTNLFKRHTFIGQVKPIVPVKPKISWKDQIYNMIVSLDPVSKIFPFHLLFAHDYICVMENKK